MTTPELFLLTQSLFLIGGILFLLIRQKTLFDAQQLLLTQSLEVLHSQNREMLKDSSSQLLNLHKNIASFKEETSRLLLTEFEKQQKSLHENRKEITLILEKSIKEGQSHIEKNHTLFESIKSYQESFKNALQESLKNEFHAFTLTQEKLIKTNSEAFEKLSQSVDQKLNDINEKVEMRLKNGFENVDKTFKEIITGVARIAEAQKKIDALSSNIERFEHILTDKKSRGIFGEVQLNAILKAIFGEKKSLYAIQYKFSTGAVADSVIFAPSPIGAIAVDSKFPLENYLKIEENERRFHTSNHFKNDMKKHIDAISSKYIIKGESAEIAILFLPAEAIYAEIHAYHHDIVDYARQKSIWIASPTTLMAILTTVQAVIRDIETKEQAQTIQEELIKLSANFKRYKERWERLSRDIDRVHKDANEIRITSDKISTQFEKIENVEIEEEKMLKLQ